ncbi:hypothetical protein VTO42DRAFT_3647 [Malbranchea cinnamomea]
METSNSEAELIFNRANVALARSQRLVASWLPQPQGHAIDKESAEELTRAEDEIFAPIPEKLGLGAPVPNIHGDSIWNRQALDPHEKLKKRLLVRDFGNATSKPEKSRQSSKGEEKRSSHNPIPSAEMENEEDESRSSLGKRKRKRKDAVHSNSIANNRCPSYLDEVLSKRSGRKMTKTTTAEEKA